MEKPKQNIIPPHVVEAYKFLQEARKKKYVILKPPEMRYGKTMLIKLLQNEN